MACPSQVARNAPAMPRTVVSMKPWGVLGPGETQRAIIPATKPITIVQRMPMPRSYLSQRERSADEAARSDRVHPRAHALKQALGLLFSRHASMRCQLVDHLWQILAEPLQ